MIYKAIRFFAGSMLVFIALVALIAVLAFLVIRSGALDTQFSPTACVDDGGVWDEAYELCRYHE